MFTTKYTKNQPKAAKARVKRYERGGIVGSPNSDEIDQSRAETESIVGQRRERSSSGPLPIVVRTNGKFDPGETGRVLGNNFADAALERAGNRRAARNRARKKRDD